MASAARIHLLWNPRLTGKELADTKQKANFCLSHPLSMSCAPPPLPHELPPALSALRGVAAQQSVVDSPIDRPEPRIGAVHEVFAGTSTWPAAGLVMHWTQRQLGNGPAGLLAVWIGRRTWPYPRVLWRCEILQRSVFVDVRDVRSRLWAAELALRSPAVGVVVADASGFPMTATRRLQLAARESRALILLSRPGGEEHHLSAAGVRWRVGPVRSPDARPRWKVELLRCKGVRPMPLGSHDQYPAWTLLWNGEKAIAGVIGAGADAGLPEPAASAIPGHSPPDLDNGPDQATNEIAGSLRLWQPAGEPVHPAHRIAAR